MMLCGWTLRGERRWVVDQGTGCLNNFAESHVLENMVKNLPWLPSCTLPITSSHPVSKDHCQILLLPIHILGAFSISLRAWLLKGGCSRAKGTPHFPGQIALTILTEKRVKFQFLSILTHKAFLTWLPPFSLSHHISPVCPEAPGLKSSLCFHQQMLQQSELVHRVFTFHKMPLPRPLHPSSTTDATQDS